MRLQCRLPICLEHCFFDSPHFHYTLAAVRAGSCFALDFTERKTPFKELLEAAVCKACADADVHRPNVTETQSQATLFQDFPDFLATMRPVSFPTEKREMSS